MIDRDPAFWRPICEHPLVQPQVSLGFQGDWLTPLLANPHVLPFRGEHGGYFLHLTGPLDRIGDLHAAFRPEGWGKESNAVLKALLTAHLGWDLITSLEVTANWRSRPPRSFGFRPTCEERGGFRLWTLTRTAWEQSPAYRRMNRCLQP